MDSYYRVLGVAEDVSFETIRAAYRGLAILIHPDKNPDPGATQAFQRLVHAWDILKDDKTRRAYDRQLKAEKKKYEHPSSSPFTWDSAKPASPAKPAGPAKPANPASWTRKHIRHDEYEERVFSHQWTQLTSKCRPPKPRPANPLRTDNDIIEAQVELQAMKEEYQTKLKSVANILKSKYMKYNMERSDEQVMQAAEVDLDVVQCLWRINNFEDAINKRFAERVAECTEEKMEH
jgi:curved DNA-binding protein CbpA